MLVYRIENGAGAGPYRNKTDVGRMLGDRHVGLERAPSPGADGIEGFYLFSMDPKLMNYIFGFKSLEALQSWFLEDERSTLRKEGFVCTVSEVAATHIIHGSRQLCYDKRFASLVRHLDLLSFNYTDPPVQVKGELRIEELIDLSSTDSGWV